MIPTTENKPFSMTELWGGPPYCPGNLSHSPVRKASRHEGSGRRHLDVTLTEDDEERIATQTSLGMSTTRLNWSRNHSRFGQHGAISHSETLGHHQSIEYHINQTDRREYIRIQIVPGNKKCILLPSHWIRSNTPVVSCPQLIQKVSGEPRKG